MAPHHPNKSRGYRAGPRERACGETWTLYKGPCCPTWPSALSVRVRLIATPPRPQQEPRARDQQGSIFFATSLAVHTRHSSRTQDGGRIHGGGDIQRLPSSCMAVQRTVCVYTLPLVDPPATNGPDPIMQSRSDPPPTLRERGVGWVADV